MTNQEIIRLLYDTGHLNYPLGRVCPSSIQIAEDDLPGLLLGNGCVVEAVRSYQDFMSSTLDPLAMFHHSRPAQTDGEIGPATRELMALPRCGCPDYGVGHNYYGKYERPKVGTGNWPRCHDIGEFHAATVYIHESGMPSFLKPVFDEVWKRTVAAYEQIGLRFIRINKTSANIDFSFVSRSSGWIGLAIVGRGRGCSSQIWCRYLSRWQPRNVVGGWTELVMHELGHNCGLNHSRGGIMNPSIIANLPATWNGDPSKSILVRYYGGEPIPTTPEGEEYWVEQCLKSNKGREVCVPMVPPLLVTEDKEEIYD